MPEVQGAEMTFETLARTLEAMDEVNRQAQQRQLDELRGTVGMTEAECMRLALDPTTPPDRLHQLSLRLAGAPEPPSCGAAERNPNLPAGVVLAGLHTGCLDTWRNPTTPLVLITRPDMALRAVCWGLARIAHPQADAFWVLQSTLPMAPQNVAEHLLPLARQTLAEHPNPDHAEALAAIEAVWGTLQPAPKEPDR